MDRRQSLKALLVGTAATGVLVEACSPTDKKDAVQKAKFTYDRQPEELAILEKLNADVFFTEHEMTLITFLGDIIIPKDEVSGSASDAGVPAFIEFIVKDKPELQTPLRGGLRWLDMKSLQQYSQPFLMASQTQQMRLVDAIAYPDKATPEFQQGVSFFNLLRNLVATGFYTSEMGVKDVGYMGNVPNQWNGVPADVLAQYGLAYTEKEINECVKFT
jgi:gluconate 2-dehydrogenase gamma chain